MPIRSEKERDILIMVDMKAKPFYLSEEDCKWVEETIAGMTTEEKIGQLFFNMGSSRDEEYLKMTVDKYHIGGIRYNPATGAEVREQNRILQENSKIPLIIACNTENGGNGACTDGTMIGQQTKIGATRDARYAYELGRMSNKEAAAIGCNLSFAPVSDILYNWENPVIGLRTYGNDVDRVCEMTKAYMDGAHTNEGFCCAAKHFPGDGLDFRDQHVADSVNDMSCEEWDASYGKVYQNLIDNGLEAIMAGHIMQPAYTRHFNPGIKDEDIMPATLSPELIEGLLRGKLGFNGMVLTDASHMVGLTCCMKRSEMLPHTIAAGVDMFLFFNEMDEDFASMMAGYENGIITEERLNDALHRILGLKAALNLHIHKKEGTLMPPKEGLSVVGCPEHHQIAAQIADQYVTLVKDRENYLPMTPEKYKRIKLVFIGGEGRVIAGQLLKGNDEVIKADVIRQLEEAGFEVDAEEPVLKGKMEEFKKRFDAVLLILSVEGFAQYNVMRVKWNLPIKQPWYMSEVPTIVASLTYPNMLIDVPMARCYANAYMNHPEAVHALIEKLMGRSEFKGAYNDNVFCGRWETRF